MENNNPLSPHLQIYKWHISSLLSITHRIVGVINIFAVTLICGWSLFLLLGKNDYDIIFVILNSIFGKFSYRTKKPPMQTLREWAVRNNIRFRDKKTGQFRRGGMTTIAFWLQKRIFAQGLAPSMFFTKPFQQYYNALPDAILENFGLEIERLLKEEN